MSLVVIFLMKKQNESEKNSIKRRWSIIFNGRRYRKEICLTNIEKKVLKNIDRYLKNICMHLNNSKKHFKKLQKYQ